MPLIRRAGAAALTTLTLSSGCVPLVRTLSVERSISVDGTMRTYRLHVPRGYRPDRPIPLLVLLHGHGASGAQIERSTKMSAKADQEGFIAVYPDGSGQPHSWQPRDISFIAQLIQQLRQEYNIDSKRIYIAGHSNGGSMAYRLGVELDTLVAGIGVSAGLLAEQLATLQSRSPVTLVAVHGKSDTTVPYDGRGNSLSAPLSVSAWAKRDGCNLRPTDVALTPNKVVRRSYDGCEDGSAVILVTLTDLTHRWPGDAKGSDEDFGFSATDEMWSVFKSHPKK
jgi:polyhydroxybutyrate depolymerase